MVGFFCALKLGSYIYLLYLYSMKKTFTFVQKNSSAIITLSAPTFDEAEALLAEEVKDVYGWRVDDEEGEDEDY